MLREKNSRQTREKFQSNSISSKNSEGEKNYVQMFNILRLFFKKCSSQVTEELRVQ